MSALVETFTVLICAVAFAGLSLAIIRGDDA